jgi:Zn finger protein HypA/HybF involved in hydrogenase expression
MGREEAAEALRLARAKGISLKEAWALVRRGQAGPKVQAVPAPNYHTCARCGQPATTQDTWTWEWLCPNCSDSMFSLGI